MVFTQRLLRGGLLIKTGLFFSVVCLAGCGAKTKYIHQLSSSNVSEKRQAIEALGLMGTRARNATDELIEIIRQNNDPETRRLAVDALGCVQPAKSAEVSDVFVLALNDQDPEIRRAAVVAVGRLTFFPPNVLTTLQRHLTDSDNLVRELIMSTFEHVGSLGLRPLLAGLKDPDEQMRLYAIVTLGRLGRYAESATQTLRTIEHTDSSNDVKRAATEALRVISQ